MDKVKDIEDTVTKSVHIIPKTLINSENDTDELPNKSINSRELNTDVLAGSLWDEFQKSVDELTKANDNKDIVLKCKDAVASKAKFCKLFNKEYNYILIQYMDESVVCLDKHKVTAILIKELCTINYVQSYGINTKTEVSIVNESLAMDVALRYMLKELKKELDDCGINNTKITQFILPEASACDTDYITILARNLYFTRNNRRWRFNTLEFAEKLFLLECITLMRHGIETADIRKKHQEQKEKN